MTRFGLMGQVFRGAFSGRWTLLSRSVRALALLTAGLSIIGVSPAVSVETCPNEAARREQKTDLSDCRAYELVSPQNKNGGEVAGDGTRTQVAVDGSAVSFVALAAFGDVVGTGAHEDYMSVRGSKGWTTHALTPPQDPVTSGPLLDWRPAYGEFSSDLTKGIFRAFSPVTNAPNVIHERNLYLREDLRTAGNGLYTLLTDATTPQAPQPLDFTGVPNVAGSSADFTHVTFESKLNLTADAFGAETKLYEWADGVLRIAGILPDAECGSPPCIAASSAAGRGVTGPISNYPQTTISDDGSRVFFASPVTFNGDPDSDSQLYMRVNGTTTVRVNASEKTPPDPVPAGVTFETATPDGSNVFFLSTEELTNTPGAGLYVYDASRPDNAPDNLTLIAAGDVQGVVGVSDDGARVYFVSTNEFGSAPPGGDSKLYLWQGGNIRYIGTFIDVQDADGNLTNTTVSLVRKSSRVTADGRYLIFNSHYGEGLTGAVHSEGCTPLQGRPCAELYRYDADANGGVGELVCASCKASGANADVDTDFASRTGTSLIPPGFHLNHPLSDDGRRLFFTSGERLVPEDRNGIVPDVYMYDVATHAVHLVSDGRSTSGSYFLEASPSGNDVFFITKARLVGQDVDQVYDLYDARVGGGFPAPVLAVPACVGADACRGALNGPPSFDIPSSLSVFGLGNPNIAVLKRVVVRPLTRAQKLAGVLKKCKAKRKRSQRKKCELSARKSFGRSK